MKPIYKPKGKAAEYGDYAINIYTGCPHACYYCFAPSVLRKKKYDFHSNVEPRKGIVEETRKQIEREGITGQLIHLCFTCDPYPTGCDTSTTREIIKAIKDNGNHVQILTKGDGRRDFDLLNENDWYGVSYTGANLTKEPGACGAGSRTFAAGEAKFEHGIKTWVSLEPVIDEKAVLEFIRTCGYMFDKVKIGKLNYHPSRINWADFGRKAEELCQSLHLEYYIKESLRAEMER